MIPSDGYLRVGPDGLTSVNAKFRINGGSLIHCCTYADDPPIISLDDRSVSVSITVPDRQKVTLDDLRNAQRLAEAVSEYISELERRIEIQEAADRAA